LGNPYGSVENRPSLYLSEKNRIAKTTAYDVFKTYRAGLDYYYLRTETDSDCCDEVVLSEVFIFFAGLWETFYIKTQDGVSDNIVKEIKK